MKRYIPGEAFDDDERLVKAKVSSRLFRHPREPVRLGRFELRSRLGRGGMGVVHEAFDPQRGERVAIKSLPWLEPRAIYRLKQEFRSLSELHDDNLVRLYELFALGGRWFFSMELVQGEHFDRFVRPGDAVGVLHAAGKLHCDLKPGNVLVTAEGRLHVLDFGLSADSEADASSSREGGRIDGQPPRRCCRASRYAA